MPGQKSNEESGEVGERHSEELRKRDWGRLESADSLIAGLEDFAGDEDVACERLIAGETPPGTDLSVRGSNSRVSSCSLIEPRRAPASLQLLKLLQVLTGSTRSTQVLTGSRTLCRRDGFNPSSPLPLIFLHERS